MPWVPTSGSCSSRRGGRLARMQSPSQVSEIHCAEPIAHLPIVEDGGSGDPRQTCLVPLALPAMAKTSFLEHRIVEGPPAGESALFLQAIMAQSPIVTGDRDSLI